MHFEHTRYFTDFVFKTNTVCQKKKQKPSDCFSQVYADNDMAKKAEVYPYDKAKNQMIFLLKQMQVR